ncbi:four-carbon acid sugar kinase family protein [Mucilaginibacter sp. cycad4]|uniref:four-carbon acid sugar kinase family protein n=1 Tax=Mucilaginibacter sp. cycad4 TaxID=3342096 RepID=UPI002AABF636|nr:four-carbon acid sugar kinase family protein [Mucilaginibacter gossypii]WPU97431.1 four-carbon acid sugar kinase family protein [Mucilaginibacter gossypii]
MIAVIADDLTGAAELAGIGLNHGLRTEVSTTVDEYCDVELLVIATDTRSLSTAGAKEIVYDLTVQLQQLKPRFIFKKIDSVLRGHIIEELQSQLTASGLKRALIVPGNPHHSKKLIGDTFYYNEEPIHLSDFANDPTFPALSSNIIELLRADEKIQLIKKGEKLPSTGIIIGAASDEDDLKYWIRKTDSETLLAGSANLFTCLLEHLTKQQTIETLNPEATGRRLFVFGSTFYQGKLNLNDGRHNDIPVHYVPAATICAETSADNVHGLFASHVASSIIAGNNAIIAINPDFIKDIKVDPVLLSHKMADIVKQVIDHTSLHELLIEGGATAWAILERLNIQKLYPSKLIAPGVIHMRIAGNNQLCLTLKPGSYPWPAPVWGTNNYTCI